MLLAVHLHSGLLFLPLLKFVNSSSPDVVQSVNQKLRNFIILANDSNLNSVCLFWAFSGVSKKIQLCHE